jgi:Xylose isomerase-like TIM barrel
MLSFSKISSIVVQPFSSVVWDAGTRQGPPAQSEYKEHTMQRRDFLMGTIATVAAFASSERWLRAQGRGQTPANVSPDKLARVSIMTLDFNSILKLPDQQPSAERTLDLFDLPQMYVDVYGVHNVEFQHSHLVKAETDPGFIKEMKARVDAAKSQITQINLEFGQQNISTTDAALRQAAIDHTKQWIDIAVGLGCPRVMINQGQLNRDTAPDAIKTWKVMNDYGKTKNVKVSAETRGAGGGRGQAPAPGAAGAPATPPAPAPPAGPPAWMLLKEVIEGAGAYSNVDIGNVGAPNQEALHDAIKGLFPTSSGNMHIKSSPNWDIGSAIRFTNGTLGYKGLYSIEVSTHQAVRIVYNTILANL